MNIINSLQNLFCKKHPDSNLIANDELMLDDNFNISVSETDTVIEAKEKHYRENEAILLKSIPIARKEILFHIENGKLMTGGCFSLIKLSTKADDFQHHPAILEEKRWWQEQGMYLAAILFPDPTILMLVAKDDPDGSLLKGENDESY